MSHLTGIMVIDAPASALNNAGASDEARTDNAVAVKYIRAPDGRYPYVSAQAVRYWLRTQLAREPGWSATPVFRETKVAYTDAQPIAYAEDDLFGYMRAASKSSDKEKAAKRAEIAAKSTPVDADIGEVTRISPLRVGTLVSVAPVRITSDFGTMARAEGDPVPHEHQFYRAHLKAPIAIDLTAAGTFFCSQRVGYKNLDKNRIEAAKKAGAKEVTRYGVSAWRLPEEVRQKRVAMVIRALGRLEGGAKQALHLTDTAPSIMILAVAKTGNQPFQRVIGRDDLDGTRFRDDVFEEALKVFGDDLVSDVYVGWARGFLDPERANLEAFIKDASKTHGRSFHVGHPREIAATFADHLQSGERSDWFD